MRICFDAGRFMTYRQFKRWAITHVPVHKTRDLVRRRRLGWRS